MNLKQVIILRKDLNMRKGKMVAQGSHASLTAFINAYGLYKIKNEEQVGVWSREWFENNQTKICVGVDSEKELTDIFMKAYNAGLPCHLVKDAGFTEFKEPTFTAVAIGPAPAELIDPITGDLKLL